MSVVLPATYGLMMRTARLGYSVCACACPGGGRAVAATVRAAAPSSTVFIFSSRLFGVHREPDCRLRWIGPCDAMARVGGNIQMISRFQLTRFGLAFDEN